MGEMWITVSKISMPTYSAYYFACRKFKKRMNIRKYLLPFHELNILLPVLLIISWLLIFHSDAKARDISKGIEQLQSGKCDVGWESVWTAVKNGNEAGLVILSEGLVTYSLLPPGQPKDNLGWRRAFLTMGIHGYSNDSEILRNTIPIFLSSKLVDQPNGLTIASCFIENKDIALCREKAVKDKIVPTFAEFREEIDAAIKAGLSATCESSSYK